MRRLALALLALLAAPLPAQIPFPGGTLNGIVSVIDWEGAPAVLVIMAPVGEESFLWVKAPVPGAWQLRVVAAAFFDSRPCAQSVPNLPGPPIGAIASIYPGADMPGLPWLDPMNATGVVVHTWPRTIGHWTQPHIALTHYPEFNWGADSPWSVGYCNARMSCPCNGSARGPEVYALVLRVAVQ